MKNFYKYLPVSSDDLKFGLLVNNIGYANTPPYGKYPDPKHPNHHYFQYDKGRILQEFQILYIVEGEGLFESQSAGKIPVKEGSVIILFPGEWHRYRPTSSIGWAEYWIGFSGPFIDQIAANDYLSPDNPILSVGYNDEILNIYLHLLTILKDENIGYNFHASGLVLHLIGLLSAYKVRSSVNSDHIEQIIAKSKMLILESIGEQIMPEDIARQLNISYSWFRKLFKTYTSFSPKEYLIELRITKAKESLLCTTKTIKEIAHENGFNTQFHFCKMFKKRTSQTPSEFRSRQNFKKATV